MTIKEALSDVKFNEFLDKDIQSYKNRPLPPTGMKYNRTPFDALSDKGLLNVESIRMEYVLIRERKSKLSSIQRDAVIHLTNGAMAVVVAFRKKESEAKPKKKRTKKVKA